MGRIEDLKETIFEWLRNEAEDGILEAITEELQKPPYAVVCSECGEPMNFDVTFDSDDDMTITVDPCSVCAEIDEDDGEE